MNPEVSTYLDKAAESLAGAASEFVNRRYNNCANRAYYACFQSAVQLQHRRRAVSTVVQHVGRYG